MRICLLLFVMVAATLHAETPQVEIRVPESTVWTGQRMTFFVELPAQGSFAGSAGFTLPQISQTVIMKVGSPVVSSKTIDGKEWFVQLHEFALFSQAEGTVQIPSFPVRFSVREGFSGPVKDIDAQVPESRFTVKRPPGSESLGFLVSTERIHIKENWDPQPGPAEVGAVFKRTIEQHADNMTGMALAPASTDAPPGVRVYESRQPEVTDKTERGAFQGRRAETLTYLMERPGTFTLPELTYSWWNPEKQELRSTTLPAVTVEVHASSVATAASTQGPMRWILLIAGIVFVAAVIVFRHRITILMQHIKQRLNPPDKVAGRKFLQACSGDDAQAAAGLWMAWRNMQPEWYQPGEELREEVLVLHQQVFGSESSGQWNGTALSKAFREGLQNENISNRNTLHIDLPELNP